MALCQQALRERPEIAYVRPDCQRSPIFRTSPLEWSPPVRERVPTLACDKIITPGENRHFLVIPLGRKDLRVSRVSQDISRFRPFFRSIRLSKQRLSACRCRVDVVSRRDENVTRTGRAICTAVKSEKLL
jgi:hypothetical protein